MPDFRNNQHKCHITGAISQAKIIPTSIVKQYVINEIDTIIKNVDDMFKAQLKELCMYLQVAS